MKSKRMTRGRLVVTLAAFALSTGRAVPAEAGPWGQRASHRASCPEHRSLVRVDNKTCPANRRRPAIILHRACCVSPRGRLSCKPFLPCPPRSPS